jgi:hypothetical protein
MGDSEYILFYSNKCLHCKELLTLLYKDVELNQKFTKINIDNTGIKIPPYVKAVPSAIITNNGQPNLMVGNAIFKWFNQRHSKTIETQSISDWDPQTMSGFSDGFSYLENNNPVIKRSFAFVSDNISISTPNPETYTDNRDSNSGTNTKGDLKKKQFDNEYETFMNQRKNEVPSSIPRL